MKTVQIALRRGGVMRENDGGDQSRYIVDLYMEM
jgi:hypothetical protein